MALMIMLHRVRAASLGGSSRAGTDQRQSQNVTRLFTAAAPCRLGAATAAPVLADGDTQNGQICAAMLQKPSNGNAAPTLGAPSDRNDKSKSTIATNLGGIQASA